MNMEEVLRSYKFEGNLLRLEPYGSGHINDTYLLEFDISGMGALKVILQRINRTIFTKPDEVMENVLGVTS